MRSEIEKYIYPNYFSKGYPLLTPKINDIWADILNILIECFEKEFKDIKIVNTLPLTYDINFLSKFYGKYFNKIEEMIPRYQKDDNKEKALLTDKLPVVVNYINNKKIDNLISTYTVVRPRSFGLRTYLYEEFIRYFQLIISTDKLEKKEFTRKIKSSLEEFFRKINLEVILAGRISESYYSNKSTFFSIWLDDRITDILQCGLLRKNVVDSIFTSDKKIRFVMDIGGSQRLITAWIYANSDKLGLKFPKAMRQYDILLEVKSPTELSQKIMNYCKENKIRVLFDESLGKKKINKIRNLGYSQSVDILLLQRNRDGKEFYEVFYRNGDKRLISNINELKDCYNNYEDIFLVNQKKIIKNHINNQKIHPSTYFGDLPVMNDNLFKEN